MVQRTTITHIVRPLVLVIGLADCADGVMMNDGRRVTFICEAGKSINATFFPADDRFVDLKLSDGRARSLLHALSASGARYANADESFVFWNKGQTAFITEGRSAQETYGGCVVRENAKAARTQASQPVTR